MSQPKKTNHDRLIKNAKYRRWLDILSLVTIMHFVGFRFLQQSTMFPFEYSDLYKTITILSLGFVGGVRFLYLIWNKLGKLDDRKSKLYLLLRCVLAGFLALPFIYTGLKHDNRPLVFLPVAALCLYDMDAKRILRWFMMTAGALLAATVLCCLAGAVKNIVRYEQGQGFVSLGLINTTDFASCFTFLTLYIWCVQEDRGWIGTALLTVLTGLCSYVVFLLTNSRTVMICGALTVLAMLWEQMEKTWFQKNNALRRGGRIANGAAAAAFPVLFVLFFLLVFAYSRQNPLALRINRLVTDRIGVSSRVIEQYGIQPFGSTITSMNANGGTTIPYWYWAENTYGYLDMAYAMLAVRDGWLVSLVVTCLWITMGIRALRNGETKIVLAMAIIAIHAFSEALFCDVQYNILLIMPFCSFSSAGANRGIEQEALPGEKKRDGKPWFPFVSAMVLGIGIYLALPLALSWLRTVFYLQGWTTGIRSFGALAVSLGLVILLFLFWKALNLLWRDRNGKAWTVVAAPVVLLILAAIAGNGVIQQGLADQAERLREDEEVIRLVQSSAVQPVYAAEKSELYRRLFGGFAGHIFSTEELAREPRGTMFTDQAVDSFALFRLGAEYTQVSPWSSVYSFDLQVIEALIDAGYEWSMAYSSVSVADLSDLAIRNGLSLDEKGRLMLDGSRHSLTKNIEYDQYYGKYRVTFSLTLPPDTVVEDDQPICTLVAVGEAEQKVIAEQQVTANQFDEERRGVFTLNYTIAPTPFVTYLIYVEDGVQVLLEDLSWTK